MTSPSYSFEVGDDLPDVDIYGAVHDSGRSPRGNGVEILRVVTEFVHRAGAAPSGWAGGPDVSLVNMETCGIPVPQAPAVAFQHFVGDVEAMAGRAEESAGPTGQTALMDGVPEGAVEVGVHDRFDFPAGDVGFDLRRRLSGDGFLLRLGGGIGLVPAEMTQEFLPLGGDEFRQIMVAQIGEQDIRPVGGHGMTVHGGAEARGVGGVNAGQGDDRGLFPLVDVIGIPVFLLIEEHIQQDIASGVTGPDAEEDRFLRLCLTGGEFHAFRRPGIAQHDLATGEEEVLGGVFAVGIIQERLLSFLQRLEEDIVFHLHRGKNCCLLSDLPDDPCQSVFFDQPFFHIVLQYEKLWIYYS